MRLLGTLIILSLLTLGLYQNCSGPLDDNQISSFATSCTAPVGVSRSPQTIQQAVALINALPKPTTVACFIESLALPLDIYAANSTSSAQPAAGERSPRIFIFKGNLIITVVPEGIGRSFVEFSEIKSTGKSLKAELPFPVPGLLMPADPFRLGRFGSGTTCGTCHRNELRDTSITYADAFISDVIQPFEFKRVAPARLVEENDSCNAAVEYERCQILKALVGHGEYREYPFGFF